MKVLIIDDEENIRFLLCNFLKKFESELQIVGTCDNGEEGLELCKKLSPDLIISDIRMPKMSGLELLRKVRETNKNCFCIFVSAYSPAATAPSQAAATSAVIWAAKGL